MPEFSNLPTFKSDVRKGRRKMSEKIAIKSGGQNRACIRLPIAHVFGVSQKMGVSVMRKIR